MAFDNVTFLEVNLSDELLGTDRTDDAPVEHVDSGADDQQETSGGGSKGKLLLAAVALVGVALVIRRFRSGGDDEEEIEMTYEEPGVEVEHTEP